MAQRFRAMEFYGTGDPYFGGNAEDRVLGKSGAFLRGFYQRADIAEFPTREEALAAGERATNRRNGGKVGILSSPFCVDEALKAFADAAGR